MYTPVEPPPLQQRTLSLLRSANLPIDTTGGKWVNGFGWQPHPNTRGWRDSACVTQYNIAGGDLGAGMPGLYSNPAEQDFQPYLVKTFDRCASFGYTLRSYAERARELLEFVTPFQMEAELWTGTVALSAGHPNNYLANPSNVTNITPGGGPPSIRKAYAILEEALGAQGHGGRGMIHCEPQAAPALPTVRRVENVMLTAQDTIIVPGAGYPGTGPNNVAPTAGNTWLYATGIVDVRIDDPYLFPNPDDYNYDPDQPADSPANRRGLMEFIGASIDRSVNMVVVRAERFAAATFDPTCQFAIQAVLDT